MVIFTSYDSLQEGKPPLSYHILWFSHFLMGFPMVEEKSLGVSWESCGPSGLPGAIFYFTSGSSQTPHRSSSIFKDQSPWHRNETLLAVTLLFPSMGDLFNMDGLDHWNSIYGYEISWSYILFLYVFCVCKTLYSLFCWGHKSINL